MNFKNNWIYFLIGGFGVGVLWRSFFDFGFTFSIFLALLSISIFFLYLLTLNPKQLLVAIVILGTFVGVLRFDISEFEKDAEMFSLAGMRYLRDHHSGYIAVLPGKPGKSQGDFLKRAKKFNFRISTHLDTGLPFSKKDSIAKKVDFMVKFPEKFVKVMQKHARQKVTQLKGQVDIYEIINEPNIWFDKIGMGMSPEVYYTILKTVVPIIRGIDPEVKIISFSTASLSPAAIGFMRQVLELGGKPYIGDFIGFHAYITTDAYRSQVKELRKMLALYGCENIPLYQTEFGKYHGKIKDFFPWLDAPAEIINKKVYFFHQNLCSQKIGNWERKTAWFSTKMDIIALANKARLKSLKHPIKQFGWWDFIKYHRKTNKGR